MDENSTAIIIRKSRLCDDFYTVAEQHHLRAQQQELFCYYYFHKYTLAE